MLQDQYRAIMQYSIPKDAGSAIDKPPSAKATADWFCIKVKTCYIPTDELFNINIF